MARKRAKFEKLGAFKYSREDGTPASRIQKQIHYKTKQRRLDELMSIEQRISREKLEEKKGKIFEVLIDGFSDDNLFICSRSYMDIPNEDGTIFIKRNEKNSNLKPGDFAKCKITGIRNYDLIGEII